MWYSDRYYDKSQDEQVKAAGGQVLGTENKMKQDFKMIKMEKYNIETIIWSFWALMRTE